MLDFSASSQHNEHKGTKSKIRHFLLPRKVSLYDSLSFLLKYLYKMPNKWIIHRTFVHLPMMMGLSAGSNWCCCALETPLSASPRESRLVGACWILRLIMNIYSGAHLILLDLHRCTVATSAMTSLYPTKQSWMLAFGTVYKPTEADWILSRGVSRMRVISSGSGIGGHVTKWTERDTGNVYKYQRLYIHVFDVLSESAYIDVQAM